MISFVLTILLGLLGIFILGWLFYVKSRGLNTAESCVTMRFLATLETTNGTQMMCNDYMALWFMPQRIYITAWFSLGRKFLRYLFDTNHPGGFGFIAARSQYFDTLFCNSLQQNDIQQIVILGAGYDSRPYRFKSTIMQSGCSIFEVDMGSTLRWKKDILRQKLGRPPSYARYATADLNRARRRKNYIEGHLTKFDFKKKKKTLFICEGLLCYLDPEAVDQIFDFVSACSKGSMIAFDYIFKEIVDNDDTIDKYYGGKQVKETVNLIKEPFRFGIGEGSGYVNDFLSKHRLVLSELKTSKSLAQEYLTNSNGTQHVPICDYCNIAIGKNV
eukprot:gb/GECH01008481.1/.p1 GENE.gb/GECH01008481.1/~~gb/GECH01008481.1/.p1  ORF type:complete len:330 (+),score=55.37 gb/GECH01008481.1/:1-990(+)